MWAMPFAVGLGLFAHDLVRLAFGERWLPAVGLLQAIGLALGFGQVAFNWTVFMRAANRTRPLFVAALAQLTVYALVLVPATLTWGLSGYAAGFAVAVFVQVLLRGYFLRALFGRFSIVMQAARAVAPTIPAAATVLALRAVDAGPRGGLRFAVELALYTFATVLFTFVFERRLVLEILGYMRQRTGPKPPPVSTSVATRA
jgi:PST family polysaccharide transporter